MLIDNAMKREQNMTPEERLEALAQVLAPHVYANAVDARLKGKSAPVTSMTIPAKLTAKKTSL